MKAFTRYLAKITLAGSIALSMAAAAAHAEDKVVRIGFQKYGTLILLKTKGLLEEKLKPQGYTVEWTEFPAGPQLLEAPASARRGRFRPGARRLCARARRPATIADRPQLARMDTSLLTSQRPVSENRRSGANRPAADGDRA